MWTSIEYVKPIAALNPACFSSEKDREQAEKRLTDAGYAVVWTVDPIRAIAVHAAVAYTPEEDS